MPKSYLLLMLLSVWLFAIFAPPVISILCNDGNTVVAMNLNEEEQQETVKKSQVEEKIVNENSFDFSMIAQSQKSIMGDFHPLVHFDHTQEILLPPPERTS